MGASCITDINDLRVLEVQVPPPLPKFLNKFSYLRVHHLQAVYRSRSKRCLLLPRFFNDLPAVHVCLCDMKCNMHRPMGSQRPRRTRAFAVCVLLSLTDTHLQKLRSPGNLQEDCPNFGHGRVKSDLIVRSE